MHLARGAPARLIAEAGGQHETEFVTASRMRVPAIVYNTPVIVSMRAERASLSERGLLPDAASQWPLASWLDHTHTKPTHDALERLIASPLSDSTSCGRDRFRFPCWQRWHRRCRGASSKRLRRG